MSFINILLLVVALGSLIFMAQDFRIGVIMLFFLSGLLFMWAYSMSVNYIPPLIVMFIAIVLLAFTFYPVAEVKETGGVV